MLVGVTDSIHQALWLNMVKDDFLSCRAIWANKANRSLFELFLVALSRSSNDKTGRSPGGGSIGQIQSHGNTSQKKGWKIDVGLLWVWHFSCWASSVPLLPLCDPDICLPCRLLCGAFERIKWELDVKAVVPRHYTMSLHCWMVPEINCILHPHDSQCSVHKSLCHH